MTVIGKEEGLSIAEKKQLLHKVGETRQILGGIFLVRKCKAACSIIQEWCSLSANYALIDDRPSISENHETFREHRHDQSLLSILAKIRDATVLEDETYWHPDWKAGAKYPIWALRSL